MSRPFCQVPAHHYLISPQASSWGQWGRWSPEPSLARGCSDEVEDPGCSRAGSPSWSLLQQKALRPLQSPRPSPAAGAPGASGVSDSPELSSDFSDSTWFVAALDFGSSPSVKQIFLFPQTCHMSSLLDKILFRVFIFQIFRSGRVVSCFSFLFYFVFLFNARLPCRTLYIKTFKSAHLFKGWPNSSLGPVTVNMLVTQSCPALCNHMDCSPPGSSVHGILQARILHSG